MATHLLAYRQAIDSAVLTPVNVVEDTQLTKFDSKTFAVPSGLNFIHWAFAGGPNITRAKIVTPSLTVRRAEVEVIPRNRGAVRVDKTVVQIFRPFSPIPLVPSEGIRMLAAEDGTGATDVVGLISLGPASLPPPPAGEIRTVRATGTTTLTPFAWTKVTLTPDEALEAGTYTLIGFIPISAGIIAARAIIVGQVNRPGVIGFAGSEADAANFNPANFYPLLNYNMGSFSHIDFPAFEFLSASADTVQTVILYLVKTA